MNDCVKVLEFEIVSLCDELMDVIVVREDVEGVVFCGVVNVVNVNVKMVAAEKVKTKVEVEFVELRK